MINFLELFIHCCPVKIIDSIENTYWIDVFEIFHPDRVPNPVRVYKFLI
jgi:hypothetical protein